MMTKDQKTKITELRTIGYGYANIAQALGLTRNQVCGYCQRNGLNGERASQAPKHKLVVDCCKNCGKPIVQVPGKKRMKFCCSDCCRKWWNSHPEAVTRHETAYYSFTCAHCGKAFTVYGDRTRKYCSPECYFAARFGEKRHDK